MNSSSPFSAALAVAVVVALLLAAALVPGPLPAPRDPQIVDVVFDSRVVVWIARLLVISTAAVLVVGGVYILASAVAHMRNREWLRRAGPFELSQAAIGDMLTQVDFWRRIADDALADLAGAQSHIARLSRLIEKLDAARDGD